MKRRRFLTTATLTGIGLAAGPAQAFRLQPIEEADSAVRRDYFGACRRETDHEVLAAELEAILEGKPLPEPDKERIRAKAACPFCGCNYTRR